ncbi:hypothetical protein DL767_002621 [Monosporascus sp. MG133]|nr:hypothetical protein DL767_002621 [Monosporascus sp. MG133]
MRNGELWPNLNITTKDPKIPTVHGGVLWGDSVNKRFFVFGGEYTVGVPTDDFHLFSYDIPLDKWDDFGKPQLSSPLNTTSYGAGVGISETGQGYYYGGWITKGSMRGWTQDKAMTSSFYRYGYDSNTTTVINPPDTLPRAEGAMVWIPAGDTGLLVYFGGLVSPYGNGTTAPQPLDTILIYDPSTNDWFTQTATGDIPQNRRQHCVGAAWAADRSSYNIYLWGGASVPPPVVNTSAFGDLHILTLPAFVWVKVFPDRHGNATYAHGHYASSCNMVRSNSQMFVIGGTYPNPEDSNLCDLAQHAWAQHNLCTGTKGNTGTNDAYWDLFNPNFTTNVVPDDIYNITGGDKNGGATVLSPKLGWDVPNSGLETLLARKPTFAARSPTRLIPTQTSSPLPPPSPPPLSTGAIVGIVTGSAVSLCIIIFVCCIRGRSVRRRREERRRSRVTQASWYGSTMVSPESVQGEWGPRPVAGPPLHPHTQFMGPAPAELAGQTAVSISPGVPSELPVGGEYEWPVRTDHPAPGSHPPRHAVCHS